MQSPKSQVSQPPLRFEKEVPKLPTENGSGKGALWLRAEKPLRFHIERNNRAFAGKTTEGSNPVAMLLVQNDLTGESRQLFGDRPRRYPKGDR